jgi:DNA-binding NtrC family response regulator
MLHEVWIVEPGNSFKLSLVKHVKSTPAVQFVVLTKQDLAQRIQRIQETHRPGEAPILVLFGVKTRSEPVKSVIQWRSELWPHHKSPQSPMVDFLVTSAAQSQTARHRWAKFFQDYPDDCHFCVVEQLRTDLITLIKRAQLRRLHAEWGLIMAPFSPLEEIKSLVDTLAMYDTTGLITGETGTGKDLVARALHFRGKRAKGPFVPVNCSAIPSELLESELFGTVKGAATGITDRKGQIESAHNGTFFFDEIGESPLTAQAKLLRVIEGKQVQRLGSTRLIDVNVRFIAATNQHLEEKVQQGLFRQDLFYRLNVVRIHLPPLRERGYADIQALIEYFLMNHAQIQGRAQKELSEQVLQMLLDYSWPGNVRELTNVIERAVILSDLRNDQMITQKDIQFDSFPNVQTPLPSPSSATKISQNPNQRSQLNPYNQKELTEDHREQIKLAVERCHGKLNRAAKLLQEAGYTKGASRGRLRNLFGLTKTKEAVDAELSEWYAQTYPHKIKT